MNAYGTYKEPDHFKWLGLNLTLDRASDCVCLDHYLRYKKNANVSTDYDPSHDGKNTGRGTLKQADFWTHMVQSPYPRPQPLWKPTVQISYGSNACQAFFCYFGIYGFDQLRPELRVRIDVDAAAFTANTRMCMRILRTLHFKRPIFPVPFATITYSIGYDDRPCRSKMPTGIR